MFSGLLDSSQIDATGLIIPIDFWRGGALDSLETQSIFIGSHLTGNIDSRTLFVRAAGKISITLAKLLMRGPDLVRRKYKTYPLNSNLGSEMIWRSYFASSINADEREKLLAAKYILTSLSLARINDSVLHGFPCPKIDTSGYEFVLFQDSRVAKVSPGTKKVIRYHDGIPVLASDTTINSISTRLHYRSVIECARDDALYVCNSPSALEDLSKISEKAASNAVVIPYFVPIVKKRKVDIQILMSIAKVRLSESTEGTVNGIAKWFGDRQTPPQFIMTLSTLEPRKNIIGLINAWQRLRYRYNNDVKLLIVGSPGWKYESIIKSMRPFVKTGDLLHLEKVAQHELGYLYSAASCFVFPSFAEGFGLPPIEAMQCGCPVVISNIPAHRYAAGEGAMYCDPYDEEDMAAKIAYVMDDANHTEVQELIARGYRNAERFSRENILPMWEEFFNSKYNPK